MRLALFEPDIPQNTGAILRLAACFRVPVDVIEPCGFVWDDRRLRRAGMDYLEGVDLTRHASWHGFQQTHARDIESGRLLLLTTRARLPYTEFGFAAADTLLLGRESGGVPDAVHDTVDARLRIPVAVGMRSLNVALAAAIVLAEALKQTDGFPGPKS
jgi:tRNA (cytidine/uridine-2'-O-)-methyltransferase